MERMGFEPMAYKIVCVGLASQCFKPLSHHPAALNIIMQKFYNVDVSFVSA